jgi:hypothetical protein
VGLVITCWVAAPPAVKEKATATNTFAPAKPPYAMPLQLPSFRTTPVALVQYMPSFARITPSLVITRLLPEVDSATASPAP